MTTLKQLDDYLKTQLPTYDLVKGEGYFYFGWNEQAPVNTPEPPPSIMVSYINQLSTEAWKDAIDSSVEQWAKINDNHLGC
jgi:hypothetical protein